MRFCIEAKEDFYPFYLDAVLSVLGDQIKKYNWIFSDLEVHLYSNKEATDTPFNGQNSFCITGEELHSILNHHKVLIIFGVVTAINRNIDYEEITTFPTINENEEFWEENYESPIPNYEIDFSFFDTSVVVVSTNNPSFIELYKSNMPGFLSWHTYITGS